MNQEARGLYDKVVNLVKAETFLEEDEILHSNREECVMARKILISVLAKFLTHSEISKLTSLKRCSISQIKTKCEFCNDSWSCKKTKDKILRIIEQQSK